MVSRVVQLFYLRSSRAGKLILLGGRDTLPGFCIEAFSRRSSARIRPRNVRRETT